MSDDDVVFRLAEAGGGHLPKGRVLPVPAWLAPNAADVDETAEGRVPGVSAWDRELTTPDHARSMTKRPDALAYQARVGDLRTTGSTHGVAVDVVSDPADRFKPQSGWDGHALIEGLKRPSDEQKAKYAELRTELVEHFTPCK